MRKIPVDQSRVSFVGTGKRVEKAEYVELSDGSRKRSGNQAREQRPDGTVGPPLWTVDVHVDDDDADRAETVGVTIASFEEPVTEKWKPVRFRNLTATIYRDQSTGQPKTSFKADGIESEPVTHSKSTAA